MRIMKIPRVIVLILIISLFPVTKMSVSAHEMDDTMAKAAIKNSSIVDPAIFAEDTDITRNDCVALVMRAIGLPDDIWIERYGTSKKIYVDFEDEEISNMYFRKCKFIEGTDYVGFAMIPKVVMGEETLEEGTIYFNFLRPTTAKEALAFMVRCLDNSDIDISNIEATFNRAQELGLIKEADSFYSSPDEAITPDEMFIMLHRFLYQKRYLYYPTREESYGGTIFSGFSKDETESKTYLEFLGETCLNYLKEDEKR